MNDEIEATRDGLCRCMDCLKSKPITRETAHGRRVTANACFADESDRPNRPMLVQDKWRRCAMFVPRPSQGVVAAAVAEMQEKLRRRA